MDEREEKDSDNSSINNRNSSKNNNNNNNILASQRREGHPYQICLDTPLAGATFKEPFFLPTHIVDDVKFFQTCSLETTVIVKLLLWHLACFQWYLNGPCMATTLFLY